MPSPAVSHAVLLCSPLNISKMYSLRFLELSRSTPFTVEDIKQDVMLQIFARLPVKAIINCKCVCKKWQNLLSESYFVDLYMSRPPQCLLAYQYKYLDLGPHPGILKFAEMGDELHHNRLLCDPFMSLDIAKVLPEKVLLPVGSVNGFICLRELGDEGDSTYICNPITKEYMILPNHHICVAYFWDVKYGFGASIAGEYKVIRIGGHRQNPVGIEVYTLGMDEWRTLKQVPNCYDSGIESNNGVFFNGHIHWIVANQLFSFDLDNETVQLYPLPRHRGGNNSYRSTILGVVKGCLSLFSGSYFGFTIWVMKEDGMKRSWQKEFDIEQSIIPIQNWFPLCLIDDSRGRTILMVRNHLREESGQLVAYCLETNTIEETTISDNLISVLNYRPGFLKLQNFQSAIVHVF